MGAEDTSPLDKKRICDNDICRKKYLQYEADQCKLVQQLAKEMDEFQSDHLDNANPENVSKFLKRLQTLLDSSNRVLNNAPLLNSKMELQDNLTENYCSSTSALAPERRIATNHVIVMKIMEHLISRHVLVFRLVSKIWLEVGTKILQNTKSRALDLQVSFTWSNFKNDYENLRMGPLAEFTTLLDCSKSNNNNNNTSNTTTFPTRQFRFDGGGNLNSTHSRQFFQKHGANFVHALVLDLKPKPKPGAADENGDGEKTDADTLRHLLVDWAPNLSFLQVFNTPWKTEAEDVRLFPNPSEKRQLLALKDLQIDHQAQIPQNLVFDLLSVSANLESMKIKDDKVKFLDQIISAEKCRSVTSLAWSFKQEDVARLISFAATKPQLKHLGLGLNMRYSNGQWADVTNIINQLLESSADSLEKWSFLPSMDYLQGLVIPVMTKLHTVFINQEIQHANYKLFPPTLTNLPSRFPKVRTVNFSDPNKNPADSVEDLLVKKAAGWVKIVHEAFPHLHSLTFEMVTMVEIPDFCRAVWKLFPGLKFLKINISYEIKTINKALCAELDSAITGIPIQVCRNLRQALRQQALKKGLSNEISRVLIPSTRESVDLLRQQPSICDLKDLAEFDLYWRKCDQTFSQPPIYSDVSKVYGFDLMSRPDFKFSSWDAFYKGRVVDKMDASLHQRIY